MDPSHQLSRATIDQVEADVARWFAHLGNKKTQFGKDIETYRKCQAEHHRYKTSCQNEIGSLTRQARNRENAIKRVDAEYPKASKKRRQEKKDRLKKLVERGRVEIAVIKQRMKAAEKQVATQEAKMTETYGSDWTQHSEEYEYVPTKSTSELVDMELDSSFNLSK